jgi:hypothetical protein
LPLDPDPDSQYGSGSTVTESGSGSTTLIKITTAKKEHVPGLYKSVNYRYHKKALKTS